MRYSVIAYVFCIVGLTPSKTIYDHLYLLFTGYAFHIYSVHTTQHRRLSMPDNFDQSQALLSQSDSQTNSGNSSMSTTNDIKQHRRYSRWCRVLLVTQVVLQSVYLGSNYWTNGHLTVLQMTTAGLYVLGAALMEIDLRRKEREFWDMVEKGGRKDVEKGRLAWEEGADEKTGFLSEKAGGGEEGYMGRGDGEEKVEVRAEEMKEDDEIHNIWSDNEHQPERAFSRHIPGEIRSKESDIEGITIDTTYGTDCHGDDFDTYIYFTIVYTNGTLAYDPRGRPGLFSFSTPWYLSYPKTLRKAIFNDPTPYRSKQKSEDY
ncbi:hypothetical protein J4E93_010450 [Alternaria ventricosa]|uniref:uncharacterized protein n=1 Tax=Alternaria ventricosa TaxID=1187951 RepID=UPI0020C5718E|nr:uncharacterized protein J4E93_010450 [Alternaria ventricosa]KAI4638140.1 hypothetical protein J4E93_010450 [Alternaria ventricosa]